MDFSRPSKRRRLSTPITPPSPVREGIPRAPSQERSSVLERAINVLKVEAQALASVTALYSDDKIAQYGLSAAQKAVVQSQLQGGKLVVCGVGKSAFIAQKLVATSKSLGISASFLHACEAVHGDIGDVRSKDVLLFVSFSGKTVELLNVLPHLPRGLQIMAMSAQRHSKDCHLLLDGEGGILLPAPIHESEEASFGVKAPTTSTTVALAISDMLALTVADAIHEGNTSEVFLRNHPGGAIGSTQRKEKALREVEDEVAIVALPSPSISAESED
ncbi:Putative SIS domain-containing protein [Septoria linicola]|uniref:SIS domain-containing protein n=1 Tax=Septoria linicola TaxID=215465 RepID=A0A9Q9AFI1_9PEZI|nr:Putative SIS domain-containing protein [Septoria linicola]